MVEKLAIGLPEQRPIPMDSSGPFAAPPMQIGWPGVRCSRAPDRSDFKSDGINCSSNLLLEELEQSRAVV